MSYVEIMFLCSGFENINKEQITLIENSINVTERTFVHDFETMLPQCLA